MYPPSAKLPTAEKTTQAPDKTVRPTDVSRQVGDAEDTASPIAEANATNTKKAAAATTAPAKEGANSTYEELAGCTTGPSGETRATPGSATKMVALMI
jgi:hypothetical protein